MFGDKILGAFVKLLNIFFMSEFIDNQSAFVKREKNSFKTYVFYI